MALTYDLTKIRDWRNVCYLKTKLPAEALREYWDHGSLSALDQDDAHDAALLKQGYTFTMLDPNLEGIIFAGLVLQPKGSNKEGTLNNGNYHEWYRRLQILEALGATPLITDWVETAAGCVWQPRLLSLDDLTKFIGLSTNCTTVSETAWARKVTRMVHVNLVQRGRVMWQLLHKQAK
jgi:hypothetical protein